MRRRQSVIQGKDFPTCSDRRRVIARLNVFSKKNVASTINDIGAIIYHDYRNDIQREYYNVRLIMVVAFLVVFI